MRKKFTMLLASLFLVMGTAWAQVYQKIPHTEWTVTALNQAGVQGNEGGIDYLKDENPETFYHSDYSNSYSDGNSGKKGQDGLQAFMVELPEVMPIDKITYKGRSNGPNNWATKARIYVFETLPDGWPKDGEAVKQLNAMTYTEKEDLLKRTENAVLGTPAFDNNDNGTWAADQNIKTAEFSSTLQGKYILFVADATTGTNGYLCCGDFHLWQKLEGIVEDKPYFLEIASIEGDWYLDTKTPMNDSQGKRTIGKSETPVPTYFTLNDGYWHISTMPGNEGNYISVDQWCATPQSATAAKWTMVKNNDGSYYLLQNNYGTGSNRFLGGLADNGKVYTDQDKEKAIKIRLVELNEAQTASEAARVSLSHVGVGYPAVDSEARTTLRAAIDAADATVESINAAITAYQAKTQTVQMPEAGKVYRLVSGVPNFSHKKAIYSNNTEMRWQNRDVNAMNQLWAVLSISGNDITLINVNDGLYPKKLASGASVTVSTVKNECLLEFLGEGQFQIKANKQQGMHANSHGNGSGTEGNIINYNNANPNTASAWRFEEVTISQEILNKQIASIENSYLNSFLMRQDGAVDLQTAVDEAKSATENYADAFANLVKAMNDATIEQIDFGYFYLKSKGAAKYAYNDNTNLKVTDSKSSPKTIFKLTKANNGTFYIQNGNGLYAQSVAQSQNVATATSELEYTVTRLQSGYYVLRPTNSLENRQFWHDANNGTGKIVGWSNDADNTQWAFEALTVDEMSKIYSVKDLNLSSAEGYVSYSKEGEYSGDRDVKQAGGFYFLGEAPTVEDFTVTSSNMVEGMTSMVEVDGNAISVNVGYDGQNIYTLRCVNGDSYARYHSGCQLSADDNTNMLTYEGTTYYESLFFIEAGEDDYEGYYTIRSVAAPTMYAYNLGTENKDSKVAMKEAPAEGGLTDAYYWKISSFGNDAGNITPKGGDAYGWNKRGGYDGKNHIGFWQGGNGTDDNKWLVRLVEDELIPLHSLVGYPTEENVEKYRPYAQYISEASFSKLKNAVYDDIILPEKGKYYRIKNNGGTGYLSSGTGTGRTQFVANIGESPSSIFYYDGKLVSYENGFYLGESGGFICYTESSSSNAGTDITFKKSPVLGKLLIGFRNDERGFYSAGIGNSDAAGSGSNGDNYRFTVEEVDMTSVTIRYMYKGAELTDLSVEKLVELGSTYTVANPYANKYVNVTCAVNGNRVEAVDGQWTVNVSQATSVIVTITEDLPFKTSTDYATANWQYLQMNSNNWKYMQTKEADNKTASVNVNSLGDRALWAFVGDAINGFKIWNKGAGEGYVLTVDSVTNQAEAYMKENGTQVWTIEKGNGGFIIRQGTQECLNDFAGGSVMKIWNDQGAPTGTGSAFRTISGGVTNSADLCFPGIFTLQAERSPLLYDATAGEPTKLSSGMVSTIPANAKDTRQQFLISESDTDGLYYLYNIAAARFVDADLNFTDYPEPVLSFEANPANPVFPWFVKIGGKYVVPGSNGEVNKIFHTSTPADDDGKRYRIEKVDEDLDLAMSVAYVIGYAEGLLKDVNSLDNSKVYLVSTYDRGAWMYNDEEDALWSTRVADPNSEDPNNPNWLPGGANPEDKAQQFAFLTVGGKTYLYSVGAGKFVVKSGDYTAYSENPTQPVVLLPAAGYKFFPIVVAFVDGENQHHIGISNGFTPPVITNYNNLEDSGNKVDIREVGELENYEEIVAEMETYLTAQTLVPELQALIAKAELALNYLLEADKAALAIAKNNAENVLAGSYTAETLGEQITALTTALNNATLVSETTGFNNAYVYTFVSKRGWMVATEEDATVKSTDEGAADNTLHQWAVYKSVNNKYYLYNIGKQQFMGFANTDGAQIPFAATPQMTTLTFKKSNWEDYPIMFSVDNVGVVNNNDGGAMIYWAYGWTNLEDAGNNHKVTIVGTVPSETLTDIENAVVLFEATYALDVAIAAVQAKVDVMDKLGYYSSSNENFEAEFNAIKDFKAAITAETTVDAINARTTAANNLVATFTVLNVPQAGKFYRLKGKASNKYMSTPLSTDAANRVKMRLSENPDDAGCIFYLTANNKLLSYKLGTFLQNTHDINALGESNGNTVYFNKSESNNLGFFTLKTDYSGSKYIYDDVNDTEIDRNGSYAANNCEWTVEEVDTLPVTITNAQITFDGQQKYVSTLFTPVALEVPTGITAYIGVKEDNYLAMEPIEVAEGKAAAIIPANTGVILMADADGAYDFTISTEAGTAIGAEDNIITGTVAKAIITPENENATCYILAKDTEDGVGLYKAKLNKNTSGADVTENATSFLNNACKAYIRVPVAEPQAAKALTMRLGRGSQGGTTSIEGSELNAQGAQLIYDLQGRRVLNPTKGMYIVNGKKMVIK